MAAEVLDALQVAPGGRYCDGTLGGGGHALAILERSAPDGQLIGLDRDPEAVQRCRERFASYGQRITILQRSFAEIAEVLRELDMLPLDGILLDLGVSSFQLEVPERGFSLMSDGPIDMRMDPRSGPSAAELISRLSEQELARVIRQYGEEPESRRIARAIKRADAAGQLDGTTALARVIAAAVGGSRPRRRSALHPATRTFMALRMAVNDELEALQSFCEAFVGCLRAGGRVAIIAFHSLEDRMVKQHFTRLAHPCTCPPRLPVCRCGKTPEVTIVTQRPLRPQADEVARNPRARSARLRVAERC